MSTVLVTGATGHLGTLLPPRLIALGHHVRTFSRTTTLTPAPIGVDAFTGDLIDGTGLPEAIKGIDVVVHCASDPRHPESDVTSTHNLIRALRDSGQDVHLVYISIVGVDVLPWSYYRAKYEAERAIETAELLWTSHARSNGSGKTRVVRYLFTGAISRDLAPMSSTLT